MKTLLGFELAHNGKINVCSAASDSTFWAIQDDIKQFSKLHLTASLSAYCFDFNVYKQANVNMIIRSWQYYRRVLGAISFLYHHDNVYPCADPGNFRWVRRWGGSKPDWLIKSSDVVVFFFFFVSPQLILQRESSDHGFFKENYH